MRVSRQTIKDRETTIGIVIFELSYIITLTLATYISVKLGLTSRISSIYFIKHNTMLKALTSIALNNISSALIFFLSFTTLHPMLGILSTIYLAVNSSKIVTAYLTGLIPLAHTLYSMLEDQAYILSAILGLKIYVLHRAYKHEVNKLEEVWKLTLKELGRILILVIVIFTILAIVEVLEVKYLC